jgi:hypothetical protein
VCAPHLVSAGDGGGGGGGVWSLEQVTGSYEPPCGYKEMNLGPLQE